MVDLPTDFNKNVQCLIAHCNFSILSSSISPLFQLTRENFPNFISFFSKIQSTLLLDSLKIYLIYLATFCNHFYIRFSEDVDNILSQIVSFLNQQKYSKISASFFVFLRLHFHKSSKVELLSDLINKVVSSNDEYLSEFIFHQHYLSFFQHFFKGFKKKFTMF
jgi:hypothetical protein